MFKEGKIVNDKYVIQKSIGKGAFSNWYLASEVPEENESIDSNKKLVLKVSSKPEFEFYNEFVVSSSLEDSPQLLNYKEHSSFIDESEERKYEYLVADFMPNGSMFDYVSNNGFDEDCARFMFKSILKGLESMHENGYAHLDIKLGNILLDSNYQPKIWDFGFSQRADKENLMSSKEFGQFGSKKYICPEVHSGEFFDPCKADIFALGVSFFILMIGDYPFMNPSKSDKKYKHMYNKDPSVFWRKHARAKKKMNKGLISNELVDLLSRMMAPDRDQRISISEIKEHPWYLEPSMNMLKVKEYMGHLSSL